MNLLTDRWISVRDSAIFKQISYKELLCTEQPGLQVALPRDDLELACIQMLTAMTQVIFMPKNKKDLRTRIKVPLTDKEYDEGIEKYNGKDREWFDLDHPNWPFMQTRGVKGKFTSIQKIMIGMPEESSTSPNAHCFFNEPTEIVTACAGVTAIALFNQASNSPSFGGGFKGSLRGAAPVSTMVMGKNFRDMIWMNILSEDKVIQFLPWYNDTKESDKPVWVEPIGKGDIYNYTIGLLRGLFWQPAHIELSKSPDLQSCDLIGVTNQECYTGFIKERFVYELQGTWPHPYSPRQFEKDGSVKYVAFKGADPSWTQLSQYLYENKNNQNEGYTPAAVVTNHSDSNMSLLIGGYKAKKAAIEYRRHEIYSLPMGWSDVFKNQINDIMKIAIGAKDCLWKSLWNYSDSIKDKKTKKVMIKGIGIELQKYAQAQFYHYTEPLIHRMLRETNLKEYGKAKDDFLDDTFLICLDIFDRVTLPYVHKSELMGTIALARDKLRNMLNELKKDHRTIGGAE
jgi:CRISPR system Cascade subunit CasA